MHNSLMLKDGTRFEGGTDPENTLPALKVYTDASYNSHPLHGDQRGITGFAYCVELGSDAPAGSAPNYSYSTSCRDNNNASVIAELRGILFALESLDAGPLQVVCDNIDAVNLTNYIVNGGKASDFEVNPVLARELRRLESHRGRSITAQWVKGHDKDPYNHLANILAKMARRIEEAGYTAERIRFKETQARMEFDRVMRQALHGPMRKQFA